MKKFYRFMLKSLKYERMNIKKSGQVANKAMLEFFVLGVVIISFLFVNIIDFFFNKILI